MTRRLVLSYLAITLFVLLVHDVPLVATLGKSERERFGAGLERDASVFATYTVSPLKDHAPSGLQPFVDAYSLRTRADVVVLDSTGAVLAQQRGAGRPTADACRAGAQRALSGRPFASHSGPPWGGGSAWAAAPVAEDGQVYGAVCLSTLIDWGWASRVRLTTLVALGLVTLSAVALSGRSIARSITRPMQSLRSAANSLAGGDLGARAAVDAGPPEVRDVAGACNAMADRLVHLVELQRAFVADASHQLRTPLTAIHIRLRQLRREMRDRPADCAALDAVSADIARFHRLVEGLLSLARLETGPAEQRPTAVTPLLKQRMSTWAPLAEEGGVELVLETGPGLAVLAHPDGLEQALDNLLANAVEVAPAGSTITLAAEARQRTVDIHVVDHGPGLPPDQRVRAFDRFWKGRPDGTGLGLAVVRQVAVANGGTARLDESVAGGVDAVISLPSCPCPSPVDVADRLRGLREAPPGHRS